MWARFKKWLIGDFAIEVSLLIPDVTADDITHPVISRRDHFAAAAMSAHIACDRHRGMTHEDLVSSAWEWADRMIEE
jgi:hypothetical protein